MYIYIYIYISIYIYIYIVYIGTHSSWKVIEFKLSYEKSWNVISVMKSRGKDMIYKKVTISICMYNMYIYI